MPRIPLYRKYTSISLQWDKLGDALHCTAGILPASETRQNQAVSGRDGTEPFPARVTKCQPWLRGAYLPPQAMRIGAMIICRCIIGHGCHGIPPHNKRWDASFCKAACCPMASLWYRGTGIGIPRSLLNHEFRYRYHRYRRYRIPLDPLRPVRQSAARDFDGPIRGYLFSSPIAHPTMMLPHQAMGSAFYVSASHVVVSFVVPVSLV